MFHPFDAEELALIDDLGASGTFARSEGADLLSFRTSNAEANKLDTFLDRTVTYDATYDARSGEVRATATVVLTNRAPASGLPDYVAGTGEDLPRGTTRLYTSLYSPLQVVAATLDGEELGPRGPGRAGRHRLLDPGRDPAPGEHHPRVRARGHRGGGRATASTACPSPRRAGATRSSASRPRPGAPPVSEAPTGTVSSGVATFERPWRADAEHDVDLAE